MPGENRYFSIFLLLSICLAQQPASNLPDPTVNPQSCGYSSPSRVCDVDSLLTQVERDAVQKAFKTLMDQTTFSQGDTCRRASLKPYVYFVKKIPSSGKKATNAELKAYANQLMNQLNGDPQCHRDFVLLLSKEDTATFIEPNSEVRIAASTLSDIGQNRAVSQLRQGDFSGALIQMSKELTREYQKTYSGTPTVRPTQAFRPTPAVHPTQTPNYGDHSGGSYPNKNQPFSIPTWVWILLGLAIVILCCCCCCSMFCKGLRDCFCPCCKGAPSAGRHDYTPAFVNSAASRMPWMPSVGPGVNNYYGGGGGFGGGGFGGASVLGGLGGFGGNKPPPSYNMTDTGTWGNNDNPEGDGGGGQWGDGDAAACTDNLLAGGRNDNTDGDGGGGQWGVSSEPSAPEPSAPAEPAGDSGGGGQWGAGGSDDIVK